VQLPFTRRDYLPRVSNRIAPPGRARGAGRASQNLPIERSLPGGSLAEETTVLVQAIADSMQAIHA